MIILFLSCIGITQTEEPPNRLSKTKSRNQIIEDLPLKTQPLPNNATNFCLEYVGVSGDINGRFDELSPINSRIACGDECIMPSFPQEARQEFYENSLFPARNELKNYFTPCSEHSDSVHVVLVIGIKVEKIYSLSFTTDFLKVDINNSSIECTTIVKAQPDAATALKRLMSVAPTLINSCLSVLG